MGFEERLAIIIDAKATGAISEMKQLGTSAKSAAAAEEKLAVAQSQAKLAGIGAEKAAIGLSLAQKNLQKVTASSTATDVQKQRAQLAVRTAEVKHADAARLAAKAEGEATAAAAAHTKALAGVKSGAGATGGALKSTLATGALVAGAGLVKLGLDGVASASHLAESVSKAGVVFGQSTGKVLAFGDTAAKSIGVSRNAAISAASSFGAMFEGLGIGQQQSADLSLSLVKLSSDLASFHDADPSDVIEATTAAFRGEYDAVQKFVPTISAAAVQTEALAETHKKSAAALTNAEKGLATYKLIMAGTTQAQGDFARTSGGLANQQRQAAAQAEDLAVSFGKILLPAVTAGTKALNAAAGPTAHLVDSLGGLPPEAKAAGVGLLAVAGAAKTAQVVVPVLRDKVGGLVTGLKEIKPGALAAGAGLAAFTIATSALIEHQKQGQTTARGYVESLVDNSGITDTSDKIDFLRKVIQGNSGAQLQNNEQKFQAALVLRDLGTQLQSEAQAQAVVTAQTKSTANATDLLRVSVAAAAGETKAGATATNLFGETVDLATGKIRDQKSEVDRLTGAIDSLNGKNIDAVQASIGFKDSLESLRVSVQSNGTSLSENTQKGRDNKKAFLEAAQAAQTLSEKVGAKQGYAAGRASLIASRAELERTAVKFGLTRDQVDKLIGAVLRIPPAASTQLSTPGLDAALAKFRNLKVEIDRVDGRAVGITVGTRGPVGMSKGGEVTGGTPGKDSVLRLLEPGEYVETVAERRANKLRVGRGGLSAAGAGQAGGGVTIAAGAVVVNVAGSVDKAVVPLIRAEIHGALRRLSHQVANGGR